MAMFVPSLQLHVDTYMCGQLSLPQMEVPKYASSAEATVYSNQCLTQRFHNNKGRHFIANLCIRAQKLSFLCRHVNSERNVFPRVHLFLTNLGFKGGANYYFGLYNCWYTSYSCLLCPCIFLQKLNYEIMKKSKGNHHHDRVFISVIRTPQFSRHLQILFFKLLQQ